MSKAIFILTLVIFGAYTKGFSQSFNVRSIFNSGATVGVEYLAPSQIDDTTKFQLNKYKVQFVKVLRTKEVDIEDFDMECSDSRANQLFLTSKFSMATPQLVPNNQYDNIYSGTLQLMYISASKRRGVWVHSAAIGATESRETFKTDFSPNFRAFSIYAHAKNTKFVPFLGPGISFNQGKFFVLPVFGFWTQLNRNLSVELIAPIHLKVKYNLMNKVELELATSYSGIHPIYRNGSSYKGTDNTLNLQQFKNHLGINTRLSDLYKVKLELGYAFYQEIDAISSDYVLKMESRHYFNISFNYNFGNSILYKFFNQKDRGGFRPKDK